MSWVTDDKVKSQSALIWIPENAPKNGLFEVWWTEEDPNEGVSFVDNGCFKRWQMEFKDGQRADGTSYGWFASGQLRQIINWKNGVMHGPNIRFHHSGYLNDQCEYFEGKEHGVWYSRDADGTILGAKEYFKGELLWEENSSNIMDRGFYLNNGSTK